MIATQTIDYDEALNFVVSKRKIVSPNLGFSLQLQKFYQRLYEDYEKLQYVPKIYAIGYLSSTTNTIVARFVSYFN